MHPLTQRCCSHFGRVSLLSSTVSRHGTYFRHQVNHGHLHPPIWLVRRKHSKSFDVKTADAVVVGAGPAGIAAVGNLLECLPKGKIVWVDRLFDGGSLQLYRECPSYSAVDDYLAYANSVGAFKPIIEAAPLPNPISLLREHDTGATCLVHYPADMLKMLSDGLRQHERVEAIHGLVRKASRSDKTRNWTVEIEPEEILTDIQVTAPMVVYCTGSRPYTEPLPPDPTDPHHHRTTVSLETGLSPARLAKVFPAEEPRTVAVIGDSHSAVLVLQNLFYLAAMSHTRLRIRWFTRTAKLKYAELDEDEGVVFNENTGLRGEAARFALAQLEGDMLERSDAGGFIKRYILPNAADAAAEREKVLVEGLQGVDFVFQAIGFMRNRLPDTRPGTVSPVGRPKVLQFNPLAGNFFPQTAGPGKAIGLFGAGIAFPEMELTAAGAPRQPAVGVWKFGDFLQRAVPKWVEATKTGRIQRQLELPARAKLSNKGKRRLDQIRGLPYR